MPGAGPVSERQPRRTRPVGAFAARGAAARPTLGLLDLCAASSTGFGALNGVVEFAATRLFAKANVGGYENTGWDLVANTVGVAVAAVIIRRCRRDP